jgi:UTP-glucose-1-phosphate uridylyltransferase
MLFKVPKGEPSCLRQALDVFERDPTGRSVIGVSDIRVADAGSYGVVKLSKDNAICAWNVVDFVEKPSPEKASEVALSGMCKIVLGPYVFAHNVMDALVADVSKDARVGGEIQLTQAVIRVKSETGLLAVELSGEALDTGNPAEYVKAITSLGEYVLSK